MRGQVFPAQQFSSAAGDEALGSQVAEFVGCDAARGALDVVSDGFAVGGSDHGVQVPAIVGGVAVGAEGELAASAEGGEDGAFGLRGKFRVGTVESADGGVKFRVGFASVADAGFESERALARCRTEFVDGEALVHAFRAADAVEAGGGEDEGVGLAFGPLAETRVDVAAHVDKLDIGAQGEDHRFAAWRRCADMRAHG